MSYQVLSRSTGRREVRRVDLPIIEDWERPDETVVYVTDYDNHRIQKFTSSGEFIAKWGSYGSGDGQFLTSYGVAVDIDRSKK